MFYIGKHFILTEDLIIKFLRGECSPSEKRYVFHGLENPVARKQLETLMEKYWDNSSIPISDVTDYSYLLDKIHQRVLTQDISKKNQFHSIAIHSLKIAATMLLVIFSGYFLFLGWINTGESTELAVTNPGHRIERMTNIGEKLTLTMSDGTIIIVNSESSILFNSNYGRTDRIIQLSGEAYFEVALDSLKPFKVETNGFTTHALGTSFNVSTKHSSYHVALTEGEVTVGVGDDIVNLYPGQMAVWEPAKQASEIKIKNFDIENITAWKHDRLAFDRKPLSRIFNDLEKWYGVTIQVEPGVNINQRVSGTFEHKNLKDILTGLSFSTAFSSELNGKQVTIKKKTPMN
ncbi:FecR family protein [Lunatibacter salilacus]|uniref:FecR family protein n=1 Tax=Lunatibacter salilacus TaxID=2483804 RepID=UPI001F324836|nr:FecR domain-containing protein [Lunatibacter salilacus]